MHVAFIGLPLSGHINPSLEVVRELVNRGHRVTYPTVASRQSEIEVTGAQAPLYESTLSTHVPDRDQWMTQMRMAMVAESAAVLPQLMALVDPPDLVVHDRAAFSGRMFAAKHDVPTVQVVPSFAANEHWAVTHKFAPIDPNAPEHLEYQEKLKALLASYDVAWESLRPFRRQIVFLPKAFQYRAETFGDETSFVGPCLRPMTGQWKPPGDGRPVLLVCMGSINTAHPGFYRRCLESFDDRWHVVMAIGDRVDPAMLGEVPTNFELMSYAPQLDVLAHASAFLCHGGMGSTIEAFHFGVPLVQVPLTPEQEANATRVVELGLGEQVDGDSDLQAVVTRVAQDPAIRERMRAMQSETRNAGGAKLAVDVIEQAGR